MAKYLLKPSSDLETILKKPIKINSFNESEFRSYHILQYIENLISKRIDYDVILDILNYIYSQPILEEKININ